MSKKIGKLRTLWIMFLSIIYTINTCGRAVIMRLFRINSRAWVDKTLQIWVRRILKVVKIDLKIINPEGIEPKPGQPTIIMCNHSSLYDIPISIATFPNSSVRMLTKKELGNIPVFGGGMRAAEFPLIDRKNRHQAMRDLKVAEELLKSGIVMWIAPEGTRSKDGTLGVFKKGAFITAIQTNAIIIPIGIQGAFDILPARTFQFNLHQKAVVRVGKPIDASKFSINEKKQLMNLVHQEMETLVL